MERALLGAWFDRPTPPWPLRPLSLLYRGLAGLTALPWRLGWRRPWRAPCPVIVVGNLIVGGAGKTPTVIALVQALQGAGWHPGVVSRGHGRRSRGVVVASVGADARQLGDEPWLIRRRTDVPVAVGERRSDAAAALLKAAPYIDVLISDDGLQHHALARDLAVWVFDERGAGNGALLPAGPLRQPMPSTLPPATWVLYNAPAPSTDLPGEVAQRRLSGAVSLADWHAGAPMDLMALQALRQRRLHAIAGIGVPERFFAMLQAAGLHGTTQPLSDHADLSIPPWPPGTPDVLCTEKDAAKLDPTRVGPTRVWVVGLDFQLPPTLLDRLLAGLAAAPQSTGGHR
ncbi:MAG: tetraacyldisaccharide 4'-kinase [Burkholderiaceae bacterium]|nr:tetraacyldisaccharide 4'-kinase [Rhodoferax sp.]MCP5270148.1 tetraacyldisaccharide 4'-kinase [Burkholderiaceae bacterium]